MRTNGDLPAATGSERSRDQHSRPVVIASLLREEGHTGVQTHVQQLRRYLEERGTSARLVTPFSWGRLLTYPVFGFRLLLERFSAGGGVMWYRHWHEVFLRNALRRHLAQLGDCVIYAQGPADARAALRARRGPNQRVVLAIHYKVSQADEWVNMSSGAIKRDGIAFRAIRRTERETIPEVDGIVYVSDWARQAVLTFLPAAAKVPSAIIGNFISPLLPESSPEPLADLVNVAVLDRAKNHGFLLDVLAEANRAGRSLTLDVYGDGPLREHLTQKARAMELAGQIRFRGYRPDVRDFLSGYRIYVHASYAENLPLAIIEAMAAGLPVVAAPVGGIPEMFDDGIEGRFWNLDDPAQAATTVIDLLDSDQERSAAGQAARDRFSRDFDAAVVVPRLLSFLQGNAPSDASWLVSAATRPASGSFTVDSRVR
jgi:glycosyltransferase involved in cell wall biosynthesis